MVEVVSCKRSGAREVPNGVRIEERREMVSGKFGAEWVAGVARSMTDDRGGVAFDRGAIRAAGRRGCVSRGQSRSGQGPKRSSTSSAGATRHVAFIKEASPKRTSYFLFPPPSRP